MITPKPIDSNNLIFFKMEQMHHQPVFFLAVGFMGSD